jgi:hypothetical protein
MLTRIAVIQSAVVLLSFGAVSRAAYLPLQTGNLWVYKQTGGQISQGPRTIEVGRKATFGGKDYYAVNFFGRNVWLRETDDEKIYAYDTDLNAESLWFDFLSKESFTTGVNQCTKSGSVDSKATRYHGPFGEFNNVVTVTYQASCADAGFISDVFLPYIGLIQHTEQTIGGPVTFDLIYSRTGLTEVSDSQISFGLALDATSYATGAKQAIARMTLRNGTSQTLKLVFPSGQDFDVVLRDDKGNVVYRWSDGGAFTMIVRTVELAPGEAKTFVVALPIDRLAAGRYTAEANLATTNPREYVANVSFDITK